MLAVGVYGDSGGLWSKALAPDALLSECLVFFDADITPDRAYDAGIVIAKSETITLPDASLGKAIAVIIPDTFTIPEDTASFPGIRYFSCPVSLQDICIFLTTPLRPHEITAGGYMFRPDTRELARGDDIFRLTELECDILSALTAPRTPEELSVELWGRVDEHTLHSIRSAVSRLRYKCSDTELLKDVHNIDNLAYVFFN